MSDRKHDDAESSARKLLQRIQRDRERRITDQYIQKERRELRAAGRVGYLDELKDLRDELARDPTDHPDRAELEAKIAVYEATITRLDGVPFDPSELLTLSPAASPAMGVELAPVNIQSEAQDLREAPIPSSAPPGESKEQRAARRQRDLQPILKGWTVYRLQKESRTADGVVKRYLNGRSKTLKPDSRKKLADKLGVDESQLPR